MNTVLLRQVAGRIDPSTRASDIAKYNRMTFGRNRDIGFPNKNVENESDTECCVAGHAAILFFGAPQYIDYINDSCRNPDTMYEKGKEALGLTNVEAWVFFTVWSRDTAMPEDAKSAAIVLRDRADKYDEAQNERA